MCIRDRLYLQLSLNLKGIVSQRLVRTTDGARAAAVEILLASPRVKDLIHRAEIADIKEAMEKGAAVGMQTFDMHLFELYKEGRISFDEAMRNADSANNLRLKIKLSENPDEEDDNASPFATTGGEKSSKKKSDSEEEEVSLALDR